MFYTVLPYRDESIKFCLNLFDNGKEEEMKRETIFKQEEKKVIKKKLQLNRETIRELKDSDLKTVAGGTGFITYITCRSICFCTAV